MFKKCFIERRFNHFAEHFIRGADNFIEIVTTYCIYKSVGNLYSWLTLIHTGVVSKAPPNFEEILLKKCWSKVSLEKLCNPQELH
jgi:hypothetical protein